jgi:hypothetical protein
VKENEILDQGFRKCKRRRILKYKISPTLKE